MKKPTAAEKKQQKELEKKQKEMQEKQMEHVKTADKFIKKVKQLAIDEKLPYGIYGIVSQMMMQEVNNVKEKAQDQLVEKE